MTLYHHLGMAARHLPTIFETWQNSWTPRSPSAASAPERSSDASRARRAQHRFGPHSCAMTGSTRPRRQGRELPAVGVSRSGAGRPFPRTRTGAPRAQVRAFAEGSAGCCAGSRHRGGAREAPFSDLRCAVTLPLLPTMLQSAPRSPPTLPQFRTPLHPQTLGGRLRQWRPPGSSHRRWMAREGAGRTWRVGVCRAQAQGAGT